MLSHFPRTRWPVRAVTRGEGSSSALPLLEEANTRGWLYHFDEAVQFYGYVRVSLRLSAARPASVHEVMIASGPQLAGSQFRTEQLDRNSVAIHVELLASDRESFEALRIEVTASAGDDPPAAFSFSPAEAAMAQYAQSEAGNACNVEFRRILSGLPAGRILEIGSRARSGVTRRLLFGDRPYVGVDVLPGEGVTAVGDAHALSTIVEPESIDIIFSSSVFEHLVMPWKVALEMNKVLRTGGIALIVTHQTCGMHDRPWDFWRFSDTAWHGIFNRRMGFEIVHAHLGCPMYIVPFLRLAEFAGYEASAGFYQSAVLVRKIGSSDPDLRWDLGAQDVLNTVYPE